MKRTVYHCDINDGNILVDETNNDKIYLIDFGLASFMINKKRIHQRTTYFSGVNDSTAFDDFFAICNLLSSYNIQLYQIIYSLLETMITKFKNPKIKNIHEITTFSFYLESTEADPCDKRENLKIYNEYKMKIIYESVKKCLEKALADKP